LDWGGGFISTGLAAADEWFCGLVARTIHEDNAIDNTTGAQILLIVILIMCSGSAPVFGPS